MKDNGKLLDVIDEKRQLFTDIANSLGLRYQKTRTYYFQIYPKNIPIEGAYGIHYEFIALKDELQLVIHIESKAQTDLPLLRKRIQSVSEENGYIYAGKTCPVKIDISNENDEQIKEIFNKLCNIFEPVIEDFYIAHPISLNAESSNTSNSIVDLFTKFTKSPSDRLEQWWEDYRKRCSEFNEATQKGLQAIDEKFLDTFWLQGNNGICSVKPGFLSSEEFNSLKNELPAISIEIANDPSTNKYNEIIKWAEQAKKDKKFKFIKWAVINRIFTAAAPEKYFSLINKPKLEKYIRKLNSKFNMDVSTSGNWAELSSRVLQAIKDEGLQNEDNITVNTFTYVLYENLFDVIDNEIVRSLDFSSTDDSYFSESTSINHNVSNDSSELNTILYGPPGTGKTYSTINKSLEIIDPNFYSKFKGDRKILVSKFGEYKNNKQIEFITFHQSYGYEEFIEGIKAETTDDEKVNYNIVDGIFKRHSKKAKDNYESSKLKDKGFNFHLLINDFTNYVQNELNDQQKIVISEASSARKETYIKKVTHDTEANFKSFVTAGGANEQSLTLFIIERDYPKFYNDEINSYKDIKPRYESKSEYHGNAIYYYDLFSRIKTFHNKNKEQYQINETLKKYVLIVDEINRGNISKIFGELITLIEPNKRYGNKESVEITLPYSSESFSVPNNLYILGTMNTADRSIALMDTALRRRFNFEEMMPLYDIEQISTNIENKEINLQKILKVINKRIEYLYDRDHLIGHSYFIDIKTLNQLNDVMSNKIIPLLQEYFYDDWEKIQIILGDHEQQLKKLELEPDSINNYRFIQSEQLKEKDVLGFNHDDIEESMIGYKISEKFKPEMYHKIYK